MKKNINVLLFLMACTLILSYYSRVISTQNLPDPPGIEGEFEIRTIDEEYIIYIKNPKGEVVIQDELAAGNLIKVLEDSRRIVDTKAACPFTNEVVIRTQNKEVEKFKVAGDGCLIAQREDNKIIKLPDDLYRELEDYMKMCENSLESSRKK